MSRILMVTSEAGQFAKTGGLADVLGALPGALAAQGENVAVVLPRYRSVELQTARRVYDHLSIPIGGRTFTADIYEIDHHGVPYYFVDCPPLFDREALYGIGSTEYPDNYLRYAVFCWAVMGVIRSLFRPDVIHLHDWQAALLATYVRRVFNNDPTFLGSKILFTIHNLGYQGIYPASVLPEIGLASDEFRTERLEFFGQINYLKAGLLDSDAISTVSPTYAQEIQTQELGFGLDGLLRSRRDVLAGIVNGVDYSTWSPEDDQYAARHYSATDLSGKSACKADLLAQFGLPASLLDRPLIGIVSRFVSQKGFDLLAEVGDQLAKEDLALVALGNGDPQYEALFTSLAAAYPDRISVRIGYDVALSHKIEAGADMFLMPSRYEPCGLNQIYSLRYGTIPIVRATGGLDDTIEESTGFKFSEYSGAALLTAVRAALAAFADRRSWTARMQRAMEKDFSWNASAAQYRALYQRLTS